MKVFIYSINKDNSEKYYGYSTKNLNEVLVNLKLEYDTIKNGKWNDDINYSNIHTLFEKYGVEGFEIKLLEEIETDTEARKYVNKYIKADSNCWNNISKNEKKKVIVRKAVIHINNEVKQEIPVNMSFNDAEDMLRQFKIHNDTLKREKENEKINKKRKKEYLKKIKQKK